MMPSLLIGSRLPILSCFYRILYKFRNILKSKLDGVFKNDNLKDCAVKIVTLLDEMLLVVKKQPALLESGAKDFSFSLSNLYISTLLLENATLAKDDQSAEILAKRFVTYLYRSYNKQIFSFSLFKSDFV